VLQPARRCHLHPGDDPQRCGRIAISPLPCTPAADGWRNLCTNRRQYSPSSAEAAGGPRQQRQGTRSGKPRQLQRLMRPHWRALRGAQVRNKIVNAQTCLGQGGAAWFGQAQRLWGPAPQTQGKSHCFPGHTRHDVENHRLPFKDAPGHSLSWAFTTTDRVRWGAQAETEVFLASCMVSIKDCDLLGKWGWGPR
jgi:hypothetical protein